MKAYRLAASSVVLAAIVAVLLTSSDARAAAPSGVSVTYATLSNGLKVVVVRDTLAPVVATFLNFRAGADDEPITGIAHAQEHMVYRDAATVSGAQADVIAGFTGDQDNADTQNEITQYFHLVPAQDLDIVLHLDAARFMGLMDAQANWNIERGAIEQEVTQDNGDARFRLYVKMLQHLMAGTVYADDGLGTLHSFGTQINSPQLLAFAHTWYHPNNATYVIAGDVDPGATIASVRGLLGKMPEVQIPAHHVGRLQSLTAATFSDTSDRSSTWAAVAYRLPGYDDPDYAASVVLADVLNSHRGPLAALVAGGKAINAEADTSFYPKAAFVVVNSDVPTTTQPAAAIADLKSAVEHYRQYGVPPELVAAAKAHELAQEQMASDSVLGLAELWSQTIAVEHRTPEQDVAAIERVDPASVDRVVRKWMVTGTASVAYAVPKSGGAVSAGSGSGGESAKPEQTAVGPLPPWAEAALQNLQVPQQTIDPVSFVLPNGIHAIVQTERASPAVAVEGVVLNNAGLEEPTGEAGISTVVEKLLPYGTSTYNRIQYQAELDRIAATATTGYNFSLVVPSANFDRALQLLADDELHPALNATDLDVVKSNISADLTGDEQNPDHLAAVAEANTLYPIGDPARIFASAGDVSRLTPADVRAFYLRAYRPDLTTIAIVGDVTPEQARASLERWFGSWTAQGPAPNVNPQAVDANQVAQSVVPATGRIQDTVRLSETLNLTFNDDAVAPLSLADTLLSGDFSSTLVRDLRVTTGYVYYVGSDLALGKTRSTFSIAYGSFPANVDKARALAIADLVRMQTAPVDNERLQRAKSRLLSAIPIGEQSYDDLAKQLAKYGSEGLPVNQDVVLARRELAATPQDVEAAMKQWIRPQGFVTVVEGPAPQ